MDISAKTKEHPEAVTVQYDLPEDLDGLVAKFGAEVVASNALGAIVISLQSLLRRHIDKPQEELQAIATEWRPDQRTAPVKKTAFERATSAIGSLSAEERQALLDRLTAG